MSDISKNLWIVRMEHLPLGLWVLAPTAEAAIQKAIDFSKQDEESGSVKNPVVKRVEFTGTIDAF